MKSRAETIFKFTFFLSVMIFILSIGFKFYLCNKMTVKNADLDSAFTIKKEITEEIKRLEVERSSYSCISYLENRAKQLGFVEMDNRLMSLNLDAPVQVALVSAR